MTSPCLCAPAGHHVDGGRERKGEPRARGAQIEAPGTRRANLVLHETRRAREDHVRRGRADHDEVDVGGRQARLVQRPTRRFCREIRRRHARIDDVPLANAGALQNPLVRRLDERLEVGVRHDARRHVGGQRGNRDAPKGTAVRAEHWHSGWSSCGCPVYHSRESLPGAVRPKNSYALAVAIRPRGVRSTNPI